MIPDANQTQATLCGFSRSWWNAGLVCGKPQNDSVHDKTTGKSWHPFDAPPLGDPANFAMMKDAFDEWRNKSQHDSVLSDDANSDDGMMRHEAFAAFRAGVRFGHTGSPFNG